jgi:hypothetical protein
MTNYAVYMRGFYYYMVQKYLVLIRAAKKGDIRRMDMMKYIIATRLLRKLQEYDVDQESANTNAFSKEEYREFQNLLNLYLNINNTYDGFNYN